MQKFKTGQKVTLNLGNKGKREFKVVKVEEKTIVVLSLATETTFPVRNTSGGVYKPGMRINRVPGVSKKANKAAAKKLVKKVGVKKKKKKK